MPHTDSHIVLGLAEQKSFFSEPLPRVQATADEVKKIVEGYECLVEQCRKKFGSSISQQLCKRKKKKMNLKKERKNAKKVNVNGTPVSNVEDYAWHTELAPAVLAAVKTEFSYVIIRHHNIGYFPIWIK